MTQYEELKRIIMEEFSNAIEVIATEITDDLMELYSTDTVITALDHQLQEQKKLTEYYKNKMMEQYTTTPYSESSQQE